MAKPAAPSEAVPETSQPAQKAAAPAPLKEFLQEISASAPLQTMKVGKQVTIPVTVKNTGKETWSATPNAAGMNLVTLGYSWPEKSGKFVPGAHRSFLPHGLRPGESALLNASIQAPDQPGDFILRLTMVQEGVAWFDRHGAQPLDLRISVTAQ